jgi:hypothetical protein
MAEQLSENSRQGFAAEKPFGIRLESDLSRHRYWECGYVYDETPVDLAVYVRNDLVNNIDPAGMDWINASSIGKRYGKFHQLIIPLVGLRPKAKPCPFLFPSRLIHA